MSADIRMVVGLGNPGKEYVGTRHNIGFELVDMLTGDRSWDWKSERKWKAHVSRQGSSLVFVKPQTFMNLSGEAVAKIALFFKIDPDQILVVYDDADLPLGKLRFRKSGSAGGHNGIKSIIKCLGTNGFPRLKIGIGSSDGGGKKMIGHVLGKFDEEERNELEKNMARATEGVNCALSLGLDAAMNSFNQSGEKKPKPTKENQPKAKDSSAEESDSSSLE